MLLFHTLLTLLVILIWGLNFIAVKCGLNEFTPLWFCTFRFILASVPAIFFIKPPAVPLKKVALYGFFMFALQFAFVFTSMNIGMTPGMASLIMQVQVFFTMFFAAFYFGDKPGYGQILGAFVSFMGIAMVAGHFNGEVTLAGFLCVLAGAASWGVGNLIAKSMSGANMIAVVIWGSFMASLPMLAAACCLEGMDALRMTRQHLSLNGISSLAYTIYLSTWVGYGIWNWLLNRYPVGMVVPFTLLIPIVGLLSSALVLGEPLQLWKTSSALLVISGLIINLLSTRFFVSQLDPKAS